jgi:hypothetical protein
VSATVSFSPTAHIIFLVIVGVRREKAAFDRFESAGSNFFEHSEDAVAVKTSGGQAKGESWCFLLEESLAHGPGAANLTLRGRKTEAFFTGGGAVQVNERIKAGGNMSGEQAGVKVSADRGNIVDC